MPSLNLLPKIHKLSSVYYINTNEIPNHCKRRDLLCNHNMRSHHAHGFIQKDLKNIIGMFLNIPII